ncbi:conserved membrane hypothetical protein [uncultured Paludibacter sp.]|nr:conserved membrane hypothetical protein [uncultured Paludibacter sp.]
MKEQLDDLKAIREMMEKSSKFLSLSGLSGIIAGITAIIGATFGYFYILQDSSLTNFTQQKEMFILLVADALIVLIISFGFAIYFSWKKAKKNNQRLFNRVTLRTLYNLAIPFVAGGVLSFIMIYRGQIELVAAITLIFYGLSLVNASKFLNEEIHYLGITEVVLGILAAIFIPKGLIFWTLGFGVAHIIYGVLMYKKYDLK